MSWWRNGVLYQIYPRSWADSNGDGVGDLDGIVARLDYLEWLGIDGVWLNPTMPSPNADWGYDVADYCDVHPELGTLADLDDLVAEAGRRGIRVLLDLVPNHTSDRHPWFLESRSSHASPRRSWYVWAEPRRDGAPPTNWQAAFGGSAWTLDEPTGEYYLHSFLPEQPELNWWNDEVRREFDRILGFWFERGIAGFRIDVAHRVVKDGRLRNLAGTGRELHPPIDVPEVHAVLRRWRTLADGYEPRRILVGETWVFELADWAAFYGSGEDELHLAFNFPFVLAPLEAGALAQVVATAESLIPEAAWPVWTLSNHDVSRFPTRWCGGDLAKVRCALMALLTMRGTPVLYYGDELGMPDTAVADDDLLDCATPSRDPARTPMHWSAALGAGFTTADAKPWLPFGDHRISNVEDQRGDPSSTLALTRDLISLRREEADLHRGRYGPLAAREGVWAWSRGDGAAVALNLSDAEARVERVDGVIRVGTDRARDGERVDRVLELRPWEGAVLRRDS